ncbi:MAG: hypothetical protein ABI623_03310, partial [bacterium]
NNLSPAMSSGDSNYDAGAIGLRFTNRQHSWSQPTEVVDRSTGEILFPERDRFQPDRIQGSGAETVEKLLGPIDERFEKEFQSGGEPATQLQTDQPQELFSIIWQLHNKYILTPIEGGLMIVDQHVAHERILYEQALRRFDNNSPASQHLLFPQTIELNPGDYTLVNELLPYFERLGFAIKPFGKNTVVVDGIPTDLRAEDELKIIEGLLSLYKEYQQHGKMDPRDNLAKSFSCKAAIKAGDNLTQTEMRSLLSQLFATTMPYVCPHGRPVVLKISLDELDHRFGRT